VERELIEQVLVSCDQVQVAAAKRLGINRNTLHKKVSDFERQSALGTQPPPPTENAG
jgi:DNA-binding protein Fis